MKKIYSILFLAFSAVYAQAQGGASICKTATGQLNIVFSAKKNCSTVGRDTLSKRDTIGFHSGVNSWTPAKAFDAAGALRGLRRVANRADSSFLVVIPDPIAYYGLASGTAITDIEFVFNDGVAKPGSPWSAEGKDKDAAGNCIDFKFTMASVALCAASAQDLRSDLKVTIAPNPGKSSTTLFINNPKNDLFTMLLADATGRILRQESLRGASVELNNLNAGLYFVVLRDSEGRFLTEKIIME
ncbi:MAG: hypothetical protein RLZZ628_3590 [Bacteroidota bacterium]|jgi:hypothetical protein